MHFSLSKRLPLLLAVGLLAVVTSFAAAASIAPRVFGQASVGSDHSGPVTARTVVASGTSAAFGRWEMIKSTDANGQSCRGIRFLDAAAHPGIPSLAEGCGPQIDSHVATLVDKERSFVYGPVPAVADSIDVTLPNADGGKAIGTTQRAKPIRGRDGGLYVATEVAQGQSTPPTSGDSVQVTARTDSGRLVGRLDAGDPSK